VFEQLSHVALDLFELVEAQVRVGDGKDVAGFGMFINEDTLSVADELFFHFEDAFAFQHHGQDITRGSVMRIVLLNEFAQQRFGRVLLDCLDDGSGRQKDGLPMGNETFAVARAFAELGLPAILANVHAAQFGAFVREAVVCRQKAGCTLHMRSPAIECSIRSCISHLTMVQLASKLKNDSMALKTPAG
jgi:hypothetical protein